MKLLKKPTFNEAIDYVNKLKKEINNYSKHLANYLKKIFSQNTENS